MVDAPLTTAANLTVLKIHVLIDLSVFCVRAGEAERFITYTDPSMKIPARDTFWNLDSCRLQIAGSGMTSIAKSVRTPRADPMTKKSHALIQCPPSMLLFHARATGEHWNAQTKATITPQRIVKTAKPWDNRRI